MNLLILHISDIHIENSSDAILKRGEAIAQATFKSLSIADAVVLLLSGDIAYSGTAKQYQAAKGLVDDVSKTLASQRSDIPFHVLMCPGNHDCDFESGNPDVREAVLEKIGQTRPDDIKASLIEASVEVQQSYFDFKNSFGAQAAKSSDKLWELYELEIGDKKVTFHCLNVAWMSQKKERPASILFPTARYESHAQLQTNVSIVCLHHPLNWFAQASYRPFKKLVRNVGQLILTGHEHVQSAAAIDDTDSGESVSIDGGVLYDSKSPSSRFNVIFLDLEKEEYSIDFYEWTGDKYLATELEQSWSSFKRLPAKQRSEFTLEPDFLKWLNDAGARFTKLGRPAELVLDDVYVFPELRPLDSDEKAKLVVDSSKFRLPSNLSNGVFIRGREQYGKTSLLRQLFRNYFDRGYVPVLLNGEDLAKQTEKEFQKAIDSAVRRSYGRAAIQHFWQVGIEKRVLLLDDLDDAKISGPHLSKALDYLQRNFSAVVITAGELFEFRELFAEKGESALKKLDHYEVVEFGHRRRLDLIKRWASLSDANYSLERLVALIDQAERVMNSVIGEGVVPSTPFFLLTILQSVELGSHANLQQSALGEYYRYLIGHSLELQNVPRDEIREILNYCANLAWFLIDKRDHSMALAEWEKYHSTFNKQYALSLPFEKRHALLTNARIIDSEVGSYRFRYPYLYFYFLGQYLAEHLEDEAIQQVVRDCCKSLHKRENGNVILFLAHHSRDARVYESVLTVLQKHYAGEPAMTLDSDVSVINQFVETVPQLIFADGDVMQKRQEARDQQDVSDNVSKMLLGDTDELPPAIAEIVSLVKTIDILGQFLKNHYGQLNGVVKEKLLKELFDGGMRGLHNLLTQVITESDGVIKNIEAVLEKRGLEDDAIKRSERAKREMFSLLTFVSWAFIYRCGYAVASPHLSAVIDTVVDGNPSTSFKLIRAAVDLEKQGGLEDLSRLKDLNQQLKTNAVGQSVLQQIVLGHMHLYAAKLNQKQKVCEELNIKLQDQRAIDFNTRATKRVAG